MIEIIHIGDMVPHALLDGLNEAAINVVIADIAEAARNEWIKLAQAGLFTTRRDYVAGIQPVRRKGNVAAITLVGVLPNLIESGMPAVDMHDTLLGPNVPSVPRGKKGKHPRKAGGFFRSIPFRHATPGTTGAVGVPMGKPYGGHDAVADAKKLGKAIHKEAKKLAASTSQPGNKKVAYGGRLPAGLAPKLKPYHTTDIYAGMVRQEKTYKKATQSQYTTFRTIAVDGSGKPVGKSPWLRPQTPGRDFAKKVNQFVQKISPMAFQAYVDSLV